MKKLELKKIIKEIINEYYSIDDQGYPVDSRTDNIETPQDDFNIYFDSLNGENLKETLDQLSSEINYTEAPPEVQKAIATLMDFANKL